MKKSAYYFLHAFVVLVFVILIVMSAKGLTAYYKGSFLQNLIDSSLCYGSFLGVFYLAYSLFIPQYLVKKEYLKFTLGLIAILVGFTLYFTLVPWFVSSVLHIKFHVFVKGWWYAATGYALALGLAGTCLRLFVQWFQDAQDKVELEKQNFKSELSLLKNQLNPHFLFNTLNNIDSLILENSPNASLALNKLSDIMRYMVYDSENEFVPLKDEISYLENYIALQKLRLENEHTIQLSITGNPTNKQIAPMLFIPYVENAFKHSSLKGKIDNSIVISLDIQKNEVSFHCINPKADIQKDKSSGIGLELVQKRLDLIYKNKYTLSIENSENEFTVKLTIKLV